jgi:RHS repeat-associated protein
MKTFLSLTPSGFLLSAVSSADKCVAKMEFQNGTRLAHLEEDSNGNVFDPGYDDLRRTTLKRWEDDSGTLGNGNRVVGFRHEQDKDGDGNVDEPGYDRMNNKLLEDKTHDTDNSEIYDYDSVYRVTAFERGTLNSAKDAIATQTNTPNQLQSQTWDLDGANNWNSTDHETDGTTNTESRDHTDFNEIEQVSGTTYGDENTGTHQLDKNGNITDDNKRELKYDAFNRVKEVIRKSDGQTVAEYTYDSMNRRFRKVVSNSGIEGNTTNGTTEYFYKDWQNIEEQDGSNNVIRQYVYGRYIDETLAMDDRSGGQTVSDLNDGSGDDRLFYHCNTQYSTFALTDEAGSIVEGYQYDAYGRQTVITDPGADGNWFTDDDTLEVNGDSAVDNPYMFQGRRFDVETKLHYYRNRYYNSRLGRFISRDPMGVWQDLKNMGNFYSAFSNNSTNIWDYNGAKSVSGDPATIISYIEYTKGLFFLNSPMLGLTENPDPPSNLKKFNASSQEFRNIHQLQVGLNCNKKGEVENVFVNQSQLVGSTPVRFSGPSNVPNKYKSPLQRDYYPKGDKGPSNLKKENLGCCAKIISKTRFRINPVEDFLQATFGLNFSYAPWAYSSIEYIICCDGFQAIQFGGSYAPSHRGYVENQLKFDHDMSSQMNATEKVKEFIETPGGETAPGGKLSDHSIDNVTHGR